jgi:hypothetical protein
MSDSDLGTLLFKTLTFELKSTQTRNRIPHSKEMNIDSLANTEDPPVPSSQTLALFLGHVATLADLPGVLVDFVSERNLVVISWRK